MPVVEVLLPIKGIFKGMTFDKNPNLTSGYMNNVRPRDVLENRIRIGQRPGLDKWGDGDLLQAAIVNMCSVGTVV